jgi:WD40 repeat protein
VTASPKADQLQLRDAVTGAPQGPALNLRAWQAGDVFLSPNGKSAVVRISSWSKLYDLAAGRDLGPKVDRTWSVSRLAFSLDGKALAVITSRGEYGMARLWDATTGEPLGREFHFQHEGQANYAFALCPDGQTVFVGGYRQAQLYNGTVGRPGSAQPSHAGPVLAVFFSPDGKTALLCGGNTAQCWNVADWQPLGAPLPQLAPVIAGAISADGRRVLTWGGYAVQVWDAETSRPLGLSLTSMSDGGDGAGVPGGRQLRPIVPRALFSPDGTRVLTVQGADVRLWPAPTAVIDSGAGINLWVQLVTRMELDPGGKAQELSPVTWVDRRQRFEQLVGLSAP